MSLKSWLDTFPETMLSSCFINTQGAAAQQTRRTCISHTTCFKFFILTCMTTHTRPCSRTHIHTTFCSTDGFKVESQLFDTHPADLIVLHLSCTTQAHWLHIWDLEFTYQGLWSHIKKKTKNCCPLLSLLDLLRSPELQPAAAGRSWLAAGRCRCWWASGRRGRPCGAVWGGRCYTPCGSSPDWWAGGCCCQTHCSRWDRTGTLSTGRPALASCHHGTELREEACQRPDTTAPTQPLPL